MKQKKLATNRSDKCGLTSTLKYKALDGDLQEKNREKRRKYYDTNKYRICSNTLNRYCLESMERIQDLCHGEVNRYVLLYPFEECAERSISIELKKRGVFPSQGRYADCYDAGMLAYLYSVHRCAFMQYGHTEAYIRKMIRIYVSCALIIYDDTKNLCTENGFREIRFDADTSLDRY